MKIDIIISANYIEESKLIGKTVFVIDMLRATSVMITALSNGCNKIIPVLTVEEALRVKKESLNQCILGGERRAVRIEGFDCANSPLEYTEDKVKDKTIIMTTTNGTRALNGCVGAKNVYLGAIINGAACGKKIIEENNDIVIVNAGTNGEFSIDDFICSGYIINCVLEEKKSVELSDIATTAYSIYRNNPDLVSFIKYARHYNVIKQLGLQKDLEYCCKKDITSIVPEYKDGKVMLA